MMKNLFPKKTQPAPAAAEPPPPPPPPPLTFDDLLRAQIAGVCVKDGVSQTRFDELLERARKYAKGNH